MMSGLQELDFLFHRRTESYAGFKFLKMRPVNPGHALLAWTSFLTCQALIWGLAIYILVQYFIPNSPIDLDAPVRIWQIPIFLVLFSACVVSLVYTASILWLFIAKFVFTRDEAASVAFSGPTTRFDRWLFNRTFPHRDE